MRNITVAVEDQTYHDIRLWCAGRDVSVSRIVQIFLHDLPRLKDCRRLPLPSAPEPGSLAALFDELDIEDLALVRRRLRKNAFPPRNAFPGCETVEEANQLMRLLLEKEELHSFTDSAPKHRHLERRRK